MRNKNNTESPKGKITAMLNKSNEVTKSHQKKPEPSLSNAELEAIKADTLNSKIWGECLEIIENHGKKVINFSTLTTVC